MAGRLMGSGHALRHFAPPGFIPMLRPQPIPDVGTELRRLVELLPVAAVLALFDEPQSIVLVNEPFVRMFGYTRADIPTVGDWAVQAYPDERYRREVFAAWDAAVAKARAETGRVESMEFRVARKDGAIRDIVFAAAVIGACLMVTFIDVSERRQAEAELRETRSRLERTAYEITENIPVGTYTMVQPPGGGMAAFQFMSRRFLDMCGLDAEEARSDPFKVFACVHPADYDDWVRKNAEVFAKKLPFHEQCRVMVGDEVRWVSAESRPRDLPDGSTVWEGVLIDITRQKEAEAALAEARDEERRQAEAHRHDLELKLKTSLTAAAAAHEIKQPLTRILMETQLAIERLRERSLDPTDVEGYLEGMLAESRHVVETIGRMKALLRNVQSEHAPIRLDEVLTSAVLFCRPLLAEHGIALEEKGIDRPTILHGDGVQLQTAVINLIRNAVEAVAHAPADRRRIAVELGCTEDMRVIIVGDGGPGFPAERPDPGPLTTSKPEGSGLGLYIVRTCMENHGGAVLIGRSPLGGAEVRLSLPSRPTRSSA